MTPKYIRIFSDIHLDFDVPRNIKNFNPDVGLWTPISQKTDKETILILAGDLWHSKKPFSFMGFSWMKKISQQFHSVVFVLGNHDFWQGNLSKEYIYCKKQIKLQNLNNVYLLQNETILFEKLKLVGATMWTNYNTGNPATMFLSESQMNDYKHIKQGFGFSKLKATHLLSEHIKTLDFLENNLIKDSYEQHLWVITHHLPTFNSIPIDFQNDNFYHENGMYASNLEHLFNRDITVWVHGHSHQSQYYEINKTKIIANPRGYLGQYTGYSEEVLFDFEGNLI